MIYKIPTENMNELTKKLARVGKKCERIGCEYKFNILGTELVKVNKILSYEVTVCDISGVAKINGWEFVAEIQHNHGANLIHKVSDKPIPLKYRTVDCMCEHCQTNRTRNNTYLIFNKDVGFKQVGKTCLKEYTNGLSAEHVAAVLECIKEAEEEDVSCGGYGTSFHLDKNKFLLDAKILSDKYGFMSKNKAIEINSNPENNGNARWTALRVLDGDAKKFEPTEEQVKFVQEAIAWIDGESKSENDFIYNLYAATRGDYFEIKNANIVAALITAYQRVLDKDKARLERINKASNETTHFGSVGDSVAFEAPVALSGEFETFHSYYGETNRIYKFIVGTIVFVWKTQCYLEDGATYKVTGKIKCHNEYNGEKQTVLVRCKCEKVGE